METNYCQEPKPSTPGILPYINIYFQPGADVHLLEGTVFNLGKYIVLERSDGILIPSASGEGRTVVASRQFEPIFKCASGYTGFGVKVNPSTGEVEIVKATEPLHSFLVRATVVYNAAAGGKTCKATIRVHIHKTVEKIWLTPSKLPIHYSIEEIPLGDFGFTVMARFNDKVVADITNWTTPGKKLILKGKEFSFQWEPKMAGDSEIDKSSPIWIANTSEKIVFNPEKFKVVADIETLEAKVTVTLPPPLKALKASATFCCKKPWETAQEVKRVVADNTSTLDYQEAPNILFLPDGFLKEEEGVFTGIVEGVIKRLTTEAVFSPYKELAGSMNYWYTFVPSDETGVTLLDQYKVNKQWKIDEPLKGILGSKQKLRELIEKVGPPLPTEGQRSLKEKLKDWKTAYGEDWATANGKTIDVTPELFKEWLKLADLSFINERGTAFGIALGERPPEERQGGKESAAFHSLRTKPSNFRSFLEKLFFKDVNGKPVPIGPVWCGFGNDGTPDPKLGGKDTGLVCIISRGARNVGRNLHYFLAVTTSHYINKGEGEILDPHSQKRDCGYDLQPPNINLKTYAIPFAAITTIAHEFAHSFGLLDEYGETELSKPPYIEIDSSTTGGKGPHPNVQAYPNLYPGDRLEPGLIKWNWMRIAKAGILAAGPVKDQTQLRVSLKPGHAVQFEKDKDTVHLRARPLGRAPKKDKDGKIEGLESKPFLVVDVDTANNVLTLKPDGWSLESFDVKTYPAKSILFMPARELKEGGTRGEVLRLIAPAVMNHMISSGGPLSAPYDAPKRRCTNNPSTSYGKMFPTNLPAAVLKAAPDKLRIVGLYEGGTNYGCCVFHAAGDCSLRGAMNLHVAETKSEFCDVCKYVIVDAVDPTKHGELDRLYDKIYPGPHAYPTENK